MRGRVSQDRDLKEPQEIPLEGTSEVPRGCGAVPRVIVGDDSGRTSPRCPFWSAGRSRLARKQCALEVINCTGSRESFVIPLVDTVGDKW